MQPGLKVEVRSRFEGSWVQGFAVVEVARNGPQPLFRLRRRSDGAVLPALFGLDELREDTR